jgi:octanoyl-[GcvH]:protein N-octanoyltransferase
MPSFKNGNLGKDISDNVVRTWIHQHTVILGIHDSRLPFLKDGIDYLTALIQKNGRYIAS